MKKERENGTAYLLWAACFIGVCGIHRFYLDKPVSGVIWLLTGGLCGIGQLVDAFLLPTMVREKNLELGAIAAQNMLQQAPSAGPVRGALPAHGDERPLSPEERIQVQLSRLAAQKGGRLTVTDGVVATGRPPHEIKETLEHMRKEGHIEMDIDIETGSEFYLFPA